MATDSPVSATPAPPISSRRLNVIIFVLVLGMITTIMDTTIVNTALNRLHLELDASVADTQWVVTGYLLAFAAVIPVTGWISDRFGTRRVWMIAVAIFMVGSLLCGLSGSLPELIGSRVLQGIGGGMVMPLTMTILNRTAGKDRVGKAIALIGFVGQLGPILGPIAGGSITHSLSWHWLFFVNIPLCLAALMLAPRFLPVGQKDSSHSLDIFGFVLLTPGAIALIYGISQGSDKTGFAATDVWLPMALGVAFMASFVLYSLRVKRPPLVDVRLFARRSFGLSNIVVFVSGFSLYALMFLVPLFYQQVRGETVFATGFLLIPQGLGAMCFILLNRRLEGRVDTRLIIAGGVVLSMIGIQPFTFASLTGGGVLLLAGQFLQGVGMAAVTLPVMTLAFTNLSHTETPRGSAAFNLIKQIGAPFGVTVIAVVLQHFLTDATTPNQALHSFTNTFWWIFAFSVVPLLLAFFIPTQTKPSNSATPLPATANLDSQRQDAVKAGLVFALIAHRIRRYGQPDDALTRQLSPLAGDHPGPPAARARYVADHLLGPAAIGLLSYARTSRTSPPLSLRD